MMRHTRLGFGSVKKETGRILNSIISRRPTRYMHPSRRASDDRAVWRNSARAIGRKTAQATKEEADAVGEGCFVLMAFVLAEVAWSIERGQPFRGWRAMLGITAYYWWSAVNVKQQTAAIRAETLLLESVTIEEATQRLQGEVATQVRELRNTAADALQASMAREALSALREERMVRLTANLFLLTKLLLVVGVLTLAAAVIAVLIPK